VVLTCAEFISPNSNEPARRLSLVGRANIFLAISPTRIVRVLLLQLNVKQIQRGLHTRAANNP
jgi:hypothetical protein